MKNIKKITTYFLCSFLFLVLASFVWFFFAYFIETENFVLAFVGAIGDIVSFVVYGFDVDFRSIDSCLDRGGRWNYEISVCEFE